MKSKWPDYLAAFDALPNRPVWDLCPFWNDSPLNAQIAKITATDLHTQQIRAAISGGKLVCRDFAGIPSVGRDDDTVTVEDLRTYASTFRIDVELQPAPTASLAGAGSVEPEPGAQAAPASELQRRPHYSMLATRDKLIAAFGVFTDMDDSWFDNLKDTPKLRAARKVPGQGGRGHISEPWFCPYEVMKWLIDPKRRKGRPMGVETGWRMLKKHFPKVHEAHEAEAPQPD